MLWGEPLNFLLETGGTVARSTAASFLTAAIALLTATSSTAAETVVGSDLAGLGPPPVPKLERLTHELEPKAASHWPETFAGAWLGDGKPGEQTVFLAFTREAKRNVAEIAKDFPRPDLLQSVTAERSLIELEQLQQRLIADRELMRRGELDLKGVPGAEFDTDIDIKQNIVVVTLRSATPTARLALAERYGAELTVETGELGELAQCTVTDCRPVLRAGLRTTTPSDICSTSFAVRDASGVPRLLSAAHCSGTTRQHVLTYGSVIQEQFYGKVDAELHSVENGFEVAPHIFISVSSPGRPVYQEATWQGTMVGDQICKAGQTTGHTCGQILSKYYDTGGDVPNGNRFVKATTCVDFADSGGAGFRDNRAIGMVTGKRTGYSCGVPGFFSYFSHIEYAKQALGFSVIKAPWQQTADVELASSAPGRVDLFARAPDNSLRYRWRDVGGGWSSWQWLGGNLKSAPVAVSSEPGHLDVFIRSVDNTIQHRAYTTSGGWSGWASLGGNNTSSPDAVSWGPGRLDVFARGSDNALWHRWKETGGWSNWDSHGGVLTTAPHVASWGPGRLDVFARGSDNALWLIGYGGGQWWPGWQSLGGNVTSDPEPVSMFSGHVQVFSRGSDNAMWDRYWPNASGQWSGWRSFGGIVTSPFAASSPNASRVDVYSRGSDGDLWLRRYVGSWTSWQDLGGQMQVVAPQAASPQTDRVDVAMVGMDDLIKVGHYTGTWSGWETVPW